MVVFVGGTLVCNDKTMIVLWLLLLLQRLVAGVNITILQQQNVAEQYPDLGNGILCQNLTDKWNNPVLMAADDLVIPSMRYLRSRGVARGMDDCSAMSLQLTTMRRKSDLNPTIVTLLFMRHNDTTGLPSDTVFYRKSFPWPTNNYLWQSDPLNRPWQSVFTLQLNEVGDDGVTRFAFRDTVDFMPPDRTVWVGFYATLSLHQDQRFQFNAMMWATLNNHTGSSPVLPFASNGAANRDFAYRDTNNYLDEGFTEWTTAVPAERALKITPTTNNMAWSVSLDCLLEAPTTAPTTQPTANTTEAPSAMPTMAAPTNTTTNTTEWINGGGSSLHLMWLLVLLPFTLVVGAGFVVWRLRRKASNATPPPPPPPQSIPMVAMSSSDRRGDDEASQVSMFESFEDLGGETRGTRYFPVLNGGPSSPVMQSLSVTTSYDHNNPFSTSSSDLLRVVISEDEDD